jgi:hypothetical protein
MHTNCVQGVNDYKLLPEGLPAIKLNMPGGGHGATYGEIHAGKFGKAAVAILNSVFKDDAKAKSLLFEPSGLAAEGWGIESKNWKK